MSRKLTSLSIHGPIDARHESHTAPSGCVMRRLVAGGEEVTVTPHKKIINPSGESLSREQYLGAMASSETDYLVWEPNAIGVRLSGEMALIRYSSQMEQRGGSGSRAISNEVASWPYSHHDVSPIWVYSTLR